jgi:nitrite reductase/ring-hydroxylating ferredoxin subunit/Fe-S cluster biogenesis protein NfuA
MATARTMVAADGPGDLDRLLAQVRALEAELAAWPEDGPRRIATELCAAQDALNREALRHLLRGLTAEPAAMAALRAAAADELVYAVLRHHGLLKPSLQERVETALEAVRPMLASHGGDVELVQVLPPAAVEVRFLGNCDNCPASVLTFTAGVKRAIREHCPEITEIRQARGLAGPRGDGAVHYVSPFAGPRGGIWHEALPLAELPDGVVRIVTVAGVPLLLSRTGARVACYRNACAHLGLPLDGGEIADGVITCPHHGFQYDLASGECLTAPEVQLEPHVVRVADGRIDVLLEA